VVGHVTTPAAAVLAELPAGVRLVRADNPGPMTLDGTNSWLLQGPSATTVVDPGPDERPHLAELAGHAPIATILVTHAHPDHVDGLPRLVRLCAGVPVGDPGATGLNVEVIPTPGHTADSVCFLVELRGRRVVCTGDTILGRGTTVVAWPAGNLRDYLASLRRLAELDGVPLLPGHGPALADCGAAARFYLEHRLARLDQVRRARTAGASTPDEVVALVYADVDRALWPAAVWSVQAQIAFLDEQARESGPASTRLHPP
jgi:glyoxylase-like metal-dependent hydrolase (beta-lactamase superfamily II)